MKGIFEELEEANNGPLSDEEQDKVLELIDTEKNEEDYYIDAYGKEVSFQGIKALKRAYTKLKITPEQEKELKKIKEDYFYFRKHYCKIVTKGGILRPEPRDYQERLEKTLVTGEDVAALWPRQSGKSITASTYLLWKAITTEDINIGIAANVQKLAIEILDKIKKIYINLPVWLQQGLISWNKSYIEFDNGTKILTSSTSADSFRGFSIHILLVDEVAFIRPNLWNEFSDSVFPSQESLANKQTILTSTAKGMNHWYHIVQGAKKKQVKEVPLEDKDFIIETNSGTYSLEEFYNNEDDIISSIDKIEKTKDKYIITYKTGINGYILEETDWKEVPRWNKDGSLKKPEVFRAEQIAKNGELFFLQNFQNSFLGSSSTLINSEALKKLEPMQEDLVLRDTLFNNLKIYKEPIPGHNYILTADPKKDGIDAVGLQVVDVTCIPFEQVATAKLLDSFLVVPGKLFTLGNYYNKAMVVTENNVGESIPTTLFYQYEYEGEIFTEERPNGKLKNEMGIRTTIKTKRLGLTMLKKFIEEDKLILHDKDTIEELFNFIEQKNGTFSAEEGYHDDMVMSLMLIFAPFLNFRNWDDFKGFMDYIEKKEQSLEEEQKTMIEFLDLGINSEFEESPEGFTQELWEDPLDSYSSGFNDFEH